MQKTVILPLREAWQYSLRTRWQYSRSARTSILIVLDSQLNSYDRELLPLTSREAQWPSVRVRWRHSCSAQTYLRYWRMRLTARAQCLAGPAREHKALCASQMHPHDNQQTISFAHSPIILTNQMGHAHAAPMPTLKYQLGIFKMHL